MCTLWRCIPRRLERQSCSRWWWDNCCMKFTEIPLYVHLIVHYVYGANFSQVIIFCDTCRIPAYFWSAGNNPNLTLTLTLDLLNPKSIGFNGITRTTIVSSFRSFQSGFLLYHANTHTHTHCDKVIAISAPLYYVVSADN